MSTRIRGVITSWNPEKYLGSILVHGKRTRRYFFFGNKVVAGPEPTFNAEVEFEVSDKPVKPGQFPLAVNIEVLEFEPGLDVLKGSAQ